MQSRCLSVASCVRGQRNIETAEIRLCGYAVIRSEKSTITTFALVWEGDYSMIYDLLELQIQSFLISYSSFYTCLRKVFLMLISVLT